MSIDQENEGIKSQSSSPAELSDYGADDEVEKGVGLIAAPAVCLDANSSSDAKSHDTDVSDGKAETNPSFLHRASIRVSQNMGKLARKVSEKIKNRNKDRMGSDSQINTISYDSGDVDERHGLMGKGQSEDRNKSEIQIYEITGYDQPDEESEKNPKCRCVIL